MPIDHESPLAGSMGWCSSSIVDLDARLSAIEKRIADAEQEHAPEPAPSDPAAATEPGA